MRVLVLGLVSLLACSQPEPTARPPTSTPIARSLTANVSPNVSRVEAIGVSGRSTWVEVKSGSFTMALPNEPFSLVFYGSNKKPLSTLIAKSGAKSVGVFPAPRTAPTSPLEGEGVQRQPLLDGTTLVLGTITVTVSVTVEASNNLLADVDTDGDGTSDLDDQDDDGDGTPDAMEPRSPLNPDDDGITSLCDDDDDNDGVKDLADLDDDGDGTPDTMEPDRDGDGILNASDPDDDNDGSDDSGELADATPDLLVGTWIGTTEVTDFAFARGRAVPMDEVFVLSDDGKMTGEFHAHDAMSGCSVAYHLRGTWSDAADEVDRLEVEWTLVELEVTACTDASQNSNGKEDVTAGEKDLWDDELDGLWELDLGRLSIISPQHAVVADYDRAP